MSPARRVRAPLFALLALACLSPALQARAQIEHDPEEDSPPLIEDAEGAEAPATDPGADPTDADEADEDGEVDEADDEYEPDQRGYEPDQRGYEPDQRGNTPDQDEGEEEADGAPQPAPGSLSSLRLEAASATAGGGYGGGLVGGELTLLLGVGGHGVGAIGHQNLLRGHQLGDAYGSLGVRAGVRIGPVAAGLHVDSALGSNLHLTRIGLYASTPLMFEGRSWTPTLRLALGYALVTSLGEPLEAQSDALVHGLFIDLALGVRWTFAAPFFIGAELSGGYTHLERPGVECAGSCTDAGLDVRTPGAADGLSLRLQLFGGVRF